MKKTILFFASLLLFVVAFGQSSFQTAIQAPFLPTVAPNTSQPSTDNTSRSPVNLDTLWYSDFSNAGDWTIENYPNSSYGWEITTSNLGWYFNNPINSTSGGEYAMLWNGNPTTGSVSGASHVLKTSQAIDVSSVTGNLIMRFEQYFARFQDTFQVQVSNNNATWTTIEDNTWLGILSSNGGSPSDNAELDYYYIPSSIVGNGQDSLYFRFRWGSELFGVNEGVGYGWMVDDVLFLRTSGNDVQMKRSYFNTNAQNSNLRHFNQIPRHHAVHDTVSFSGAIQNKGTLTQTGALMQVNIEHPFGYDSVMSAPQSISVNQTDSFNTAELTPFDQGPGQYSVNFIARTDSTDDLPINDTIYYPLQVTDTTYARDFDNHSGDGQWYGSTTSYRIGNMYTLHEADTVTSASFLFQASTQPGAQVRAHVYNDQFQLLTSSNIITLTAAQIGNWITINLPDTPLQPGDYLVAFQTFGDPVAWGIDETNPQPDNFQVYASLGFSWFYTNISIPMIRMNVKGPYCPPFNASHLVFNSPDCDPTNLDGSAQALPISGTAPFQFSWSNGEVGPVANNLETGDITVRITDANLCSGIYQFNLPLPDGPDASIVQEVDVLCRNECNGAVEVAATGGTPPYSYTWSQSNASGNFPDNLCFGSFAVTITDSLGCTDQLNGFLLQPNDTLSAQASSPANGQVLASASGGTPPYNYNWSSGDAGASVSNLPIGTYTVTVSDANECEKILSVEVTQASFVSEEIARSIRIFPNPAKQMVTIEQFGVPISGKVQILNVMGAVVLEQQLNITDHQLTIDLQNFDPGMYFLRLHSDQAIVLLDQLIIQ